MTERSEMHDFNWAIDEWRNGRSAVRERWDNTAECRVDESTRQLANTTLLGERIATMRHLDFDDIDAKDWRSANSISNHRQTSDHAPA